MAATLLQRLEETTARLETELHRREEAERQLDLLSQDNGQLRVELGQAQSQLKIQGKELEMLALLLERDRQRVLAEIKIEAHKIALAARRALQMGES